MYHLVTTICTLRAYLFIEQHKEKIMLRQYHTPQGIIEREPTQGELDREFEMKKESPDFQTMVKTIAELTGKTEKEVEGTFKKHYKG